MECAPLAAAATQQSNVHLRDIAGSLCMLSTPHQSLRATVSKYLVAFRPDYTLANRAPVPRRIDANIYIITTIKVTALRLVRDNWAHSMGP